MWEQRQGLEWILSSQRRLSLRWRCTKDLCCHLLFLRLLAENEKRITCVMMIHTIHQNKEIMVAAQCSLNTVKTIRNEMENSDGDYEAVARRKKHNR